MIITRTPFRFSFCGGGSDIPSYYEKHGGCTLSTTVDKYMYISIHPYFYPGSTVLKYSQTEIVSSADEIQHKYFHTILKEMGVWGVEISSTADIPSGTGLGSSSAFTVGVLHALNSYKGKFVSKEYLASQACHVEIDQLHEPIGKQDQYAAAYGGLNFYQFNRDGSVFVDPIIMNGSDKDHLESRLMVFFTGEIRSASAILKKQSEAYASAEKDQVQGRMCDLAWDLKRSLENGLVDDTGPILHAGWMLKKSLVDGISNPAIDECYQKALANGATGGKLLGAGGSGFLMFYVPPEHQEAVRQAVDLPQLNFKFDSQGSCVIYVGPKPDVPHFQEKK